MYTPKSNVNSGQIQLKKAEKSLPGVFGALENIRFSALGVDVECLVDSVS